MSHIMPDPVDAQFPLVAALIAGDPAPIKPDRLVLSTGQEYADAICEIAVLARGENPDRLVALVGAALRYTDVKARAEVLTEADVVEARSYRRLAEAIGATMTDPDQWDGDDDEPTILVRYVEWLAAGSPTEDGWPTMPEAGESRG